VNPRLNSGDLQIQRDIGALAVRGTGIDVAELAPAGKEASARDGNGGNEPAADGLNSAMK
jgi:hypothetical protein